jgi:hypothetical protein
VLRASDNRLAIVSTLAPTEYGIRTLMHDPMYRNGVGESTPLSAPWSDAAKTYVKGDQVSSDGHVYVAQKWTQDKKPDSTATGLSIVLVQSLRQPAPTSARGPRRGFTPAARRRA